MAQQKQDDTLNPVDVHVGSRIRLRRTFLSISQEKLGDELGISFQQVQKYERGANRVSSSRLFDVARILDVPISFFFDSMDDKLISGLPRPVNVQPEPTSKSDSISMKDPETVEFVERYYNIEDEATRRRIYELVRALGEFCRNNPATAED